MTTHQAVLRLIVRLEKKGRWYVELKKIGGWHITDLQRKLEIW